MTWFHKIMYSHALLQDLWTKTRGLTLQRASSCAEYKAGNPMSSVPADFSQCHATVVALGLSLQIQFAIEGWEGGLEFEDLGSSWGDVSQTFKLNISCRLQVIGFTDPRGVLWLKRSCSRGRRRMGDWKKKPYSPSTPTSHFCFKNRLNSLSLKGWRKERTENELYNISPKNPSTTTNN